MLRVRVRVRVVRVRVRVRVVRVRLCTMIGLNHDSCFLIVILF